MKLSRFLFSAAILAGLVGHAEAQIANGRVTTAAPTYTNNSTSPVSLDTSGNLRTNCVAGCAGGSFNNNADGVATSATNGQSAAWLYGWNGASFDRLQVDGSKSLKATILGISGTISLPTGASTAAKQPALGTAGTASTDVITVQGIAGMTKLLVTPDLPSGASTAANQTSPLAPLTPATATATTSMMLGGQYNSTLPTFTNGQQGGLQVGTRGSLNVTAFDDDSSSPISTSATNSDTFAASATTNFYTVNALNRVFDGTNFARSQQAQNSTNSVGTGIPAAAQVGQCDDTSPTAITENSFGNQRIDCATHAHITTPVPSATAGGTTLYTLTLANSTNATNVKASAGQVYSISGFAISATPVWVSLYNTAGTPTCGTSIIQQFLIPGSTAGAGFVYDFAMPKGFATGIGFCATTGIAGTGSVAASSYVLNIDYK